jgi:hypothetical protein
VSSDPRVDDLRQRLRALGYLDAGVDRFVLGPARSTRQPLTFTILASLRVGLLAALLLGPAATIGLGARLPGLVTGPRDAVVVAIYLGIAFGAAMALAALAAALLVALAARAWAGALARHGHVLPRIAGGAIGLACLIYLTLWWQMVIAGVGWSAPVWTASALAIAVAISLLLGHAVAMVTSALLVARTTRADGAGAVRKRPLRSSRSLAIAAAVAFGAAALLLTWSDRSATEPAAPALTVVPSGLRLKVLAIDGFDPRVFEELSAAGQVPALTAAFRGAVVELAPDADAPPDPARIWTTIATGQPAARHGVRGLEARRVPGVGGTMPMAAPSGTWTAIRNVTDLLRFTRPALVSGSERRAKAFWEVASDAGLRTSVVNWWVTWPAYSSDGIVLSDRATLRLEHGGELDAELTPASLYTDLRQRWPALTSRAGQIGRDALSSRGADGDSALLQRSAELDGLQLALSAAVSSSSTDLAVAYLPGLDIAQHALIGGQGTAVAASTLAARLQSVKDYYVALDRLLSAHGAVEPRGDEAIVILTQPGRIGASVSGRLAARGRLLSASRSSGTLTDIAPTLLHALGLPVAADLAGRPVTAVFSPAFASAYTVRFVESYGEPRRRGEARAGTPLDQEMIDRLRSLGYVR